MHTRPELFGSRKRKRPLSRIFTWAIAGPNAVAASWDRWLTPVLARNFLQRAISFNLEGLSFWAISFMLPGPVRRNGPGSRTSFRNLPVERRSLQCVAIMTGGLPPNSVTSRSRMSSRGQIASVTAAHGDRFDFAWPENHTLILGHLHPALAIRDSSGAGHKLPVFLANRNCIVLPAFSPFARGYDVICGLPPELARCFGPDEIEVYAASGKKVARLGPLRTALNTMAESDVSSAAQFRRGYRKT